MTVRRIKQAASGTAAPVVDPTSPTVPAPESGVILTSDAYFATVRKTLIDLGSGSPDADIGHSKEFWKHCQQAGVSPEVCAAVIYGSIRHKHTGETGSAQTATLREPSAESPTREEWEVVVKRAGISTDAITSAAGRRPSEVTTGNAVFGGFNDDEKAAAFSRKMTEAGYTATFGPRREYTLHEAAESRAVTSRQELGALMHHWHASSGDPLYAVGSYYYSDMPYPNKGTVEAAKVEAERILRRLSSNSPERRELRRIVRGLDHFLLADYPAGAGESVAVVERTDLLTSQTTAVVADESVQSQIRAKRPDLLACKTCIPWQKVSRDGTEHADFAELAKKFGPIKTPVDVYAVVGDDLNNETQEVFLLLPLNIHGELMGPAYEIARGQRDRVAVGIDNVMDAASDARCAGFVVTHQHPGNSPKPSKADLKLTKDIRKATPPGRTFIDHVVIGQKCAYSIVESKLYEIP